MDISKALATGSRSLQIDWPLTLVCFDTDMHGHGTVMLPVLPVCYGVEGTHGSYSGRFKLCLHLTRPDPDPDANTEEWRHIALHKSLPGTPNWQCGVDSMWQFSSMQIIKLSFWRLNYIVWVLWSLIFVLFSPFPGRGCASMSFCFQTDTTLKHLISMSDNVLSNLSGCTTLLCTYILWHLCSHGKQHLRCSCLWMMLNPE